MICLSNQRGPRFMKTVYLIPAAIILMSCSAPETSAPTTPPRNLDVSWDKECAGDFYRDVAQTEDDQTGVPWMTLYNSGGNALIHKIGFPHGEGDEWPQIIKKNVLLSPEDYPSPDTIAPKIGLTAEDLTQDDYNFVIYGGDWCAPCVRQKAAVENLRVLRPDLSIGMVVVEADIARFDYEVTCKA